MIKKTTAILIAVLCLLLAAGCGKKNKAAEVEETMPPAEAVEMEPTEAPEETIPPEWDIDAVITPEPAGAASGEPAEEEAGEGNAEKSNSSDKKSGKSAGKKSGDEPFVAVVTATPAPTSAPTDDPNPIVQEESDQPIYFMPVMELE